MAYFFLILTLHPSFPHLLGAGDKAVLVLVVTEVISYYLKRKLLLLITAFS